MPNHPNNTDDHFLLWVISGVIGELVRDFFVLLLLLFGVFKIAIWDVAADIFLKAKDIHTFWGTMVGLIADLTIGAGLGILTGLLIRKTGTKNYIIKGIGVSLGAWLLFIGILLHNLPSVEVYTNGPGEIPFLVFLTILLHGIYGAVTAWTYMKLAKLDSSSNSWKRIK